MAKNIILCSDGTGNSALKGRGTNVFKLYETVDLNGHKFDNNLVEQVAFYDDGVGTESFKLLKILGGAFGYGLSRNVKQLYSALAKCYEPGDNIYLFGFSRGAFTVRQLAGFIIGCGIIDKSKWKTDSDLKKLVKMAFRKYRKRHRTWLGERLKRFFPSDKKAREEFRRTFAFQHKEFAPEGKLKIKFIGVWDTVAAVGLPFDHLADFINTFIYRFKFPDRQLSSRVDKACHALSIDDERHSFHPEMWDETKEDTDVRIEQVWFPGVHSNIGGGYPKQGMSLVTMDWIMAKAEEQGLRFISCNRACYHDQQNVNDKLYDSRSGMGIYYRYKVRDIETFSKNNHASPDIHISTFNRIFLGTDGYAPVNIPEGLNIVTTPHHPPASGEEPSHLKSLSEKIGGAISERREELKQAGKWMLIRRYSHYTFIILTIAILYAIKKIGSTEIIESSFLNSCLGIIRFIAGETVADHIIKPILTRPEISLSLAGFIVLFYLIGLLARYNIRKIFSAFWRNTMKDKPLE